MGSVFLRQATKLAEKFLGLVGKSPQGYSACFRCSAMARRDADSARVCPLSQVVVGFPGQVGFQALAYLIYVIEACRRLVVVLCGVVLCGVVL